MGKTGDSRRRRKMSYRPKRPYRAGFLQHMPFVSSSGAAICPVCDSKVPLEELDTHTCCIQCYHQTSIVNAQKILKEGFKRGKKGLAGGGIYFATSVEDTNPKAHEKGVILVADVHVGRVCYKTKGGCTGKETFTQLKKEGYDSVRITGLRTGDEIVVYNSTQVSNIRRL